jgi:hypothetical protein
MGLNLSWRISNPDFAIDPAIIAEIIDGLERSLERTVNVNSLSTFEQDL